jgi:dTDP-4-amino-4,6-dideoxygalactose transaminase
MSRVSRHLLARFDLDKIIATRRENYSILEKLLSGINGLRSLMGPLPAKTCPWLFLAVVNDPLNLHQGLLNQRIESIVFWAYFHERFPMGCMKEAEYLKKHVLALPIHQDLGPDHMEYIAHAVRGYLAGKS